MSLDIGGLVREGFDRTVSRNGLLLVVVFYLVGVPSAIASSELNRQLVGEAMTAPTPAPGTTPAGPGLGLPVSVAALLTVVLSIVSVVLLVGAIRTFLGEDTETLDPSDFTDNIVWLFVNILVGGIVFGILIAIGFALLVIPGIFLLVSLFFWNYVIIDEGANFVEGFQRSWSLTSGNRLELFLLGVVIAVIGLLINVVFGIPGAFLPDLAAPLVGQIGSAFATVFFYATGARTYLALTGEDGGTADEPSEPVGTEHALE